MKTTRALLASVLGAAALWVAQPAAAQSFLMPSTPEQGVWVEATHSDFKAFETSFPSTVWYLSGRMPINERVRGVVDLPFSYARMDLGTGTAESSSVLGNPYVGLEYAAAERIVVDLGVRAPITSADEESFADAVALLADPQRGEAFAADMLPVSLAANYSHALSPEMGLRARAGVTELFYTGDDPAAGNETAVDYGVAGSYSAAMARFGLGLSGRWFASQEEGSWADNSLHYVGATADLQAGRVRPGVSLRVPLDKDLRDIVSSSIGLYLQVPLQ